MLIFLTIILISVLIHYFIYRYLNRSRYTDSLDFWDEGGLYTFFIACALGVMISVAVTDGVHQDKFVEKCEIIDSVKIYSINDSITTSGSFVLGTGTVDSDMCYYFYQEIENEHVDGKSYKLGKVESRKAQIVYITDDSEPRIEKHIHCETSDSFFLDYCVSCFACLSDEDIYFIYLPENSIIQSYTLDLQ